MPPVFKRIDIKGYRVLGYEQIGEALSIRVTPYRQKAPPCSTCGSARVRSKGYRKRTLRHLPVFKRDTRLIVYFKRYRCCRCRATFNPQLPGILAHQQSTEPYREHLAKLHHEGIPCSSMAKLFRIASATVARFYTHFNQRKAAERISLRCPLVLGIDEHTLHKKQRFATTLCDLRKHKVFDVLEGKSNTDLAAQIERLQGRDRVRIVCIDLSSSYRALVKRYFPNARIVADRFHVIRIILHHFITLCRQIMGDYAAKNKASTLLRTNPENLSKKGRLRLKAIFLRFPAIERLYREMRKLHRLLSKKHQTKRQCRRLTQRLSQAIQRLEGSNFAPLITLANTLTTWIEPIACMWRSTKNNGITEGLHRKMKLLQRRAYGFKNFDNYRLRVIAHCG